MGAASTGAIAPAPTRASTGASTEASTEASTGASTQALHGALPGALHAALPGALPGALIEADRLDMRYGTGRLALDGASLSVAAGELLVILGHNGCGKSTLLKCIAGLLRPTAGRVRVAGRDITSLSGRALSEARMAMAMVFQQSRLVGRRSVLANVQCGTLGRHQTVASALGVLPRAEQPHALACLSQVGLADFATQRAGTLSGGQAQRTSIARALAQRPAALLADEPVASLDPEASEEVMRLLRRISAEDGLAVICVLHQPALARRYADRIVGMRQGRVMFDAAPAAIADDRMQALYEGVGNDGVLQAGALHAGAIQPGAMRAGAAHAGQVTHGVTT